MESIDDVKGSLHRMEANSKVHSIVVQHLNREMHYSVGQKMGNLEIMTIVVDDDYYKLRGVLRYVITVEDNGIEVVWKSFMDLPVAITYKI